MLVFYTRYATEAPISLRIVGWCLAPAGLYVLVAASKGALGVDSRVPFAWLLPAVLGFTAVSVATLWMRGAGRRAGVLPAHWVVAFVVIVNVAQIVRMGFGSIGLVRAVVPMVLSAGFLGMAAFAVWRTIAASAVSSAPVAAPRYERSGLDASLAHDLLPRIEQALTRERLFARADLTLAHLAAAVDATPHQISEVLNRYARVSFNDLINRRRIEDVKAQLLDPASERFTIEGIGASAGFGSRSALYAAFRRFEGTTPTEFRASRRPKP
jgi:AraC-like DNA-binding protein